MPPGSCPAACATPITSAPMMRPDVQHRRQMRCVSTSPSRSPNPPLLLPRCIMHRFESSAHTDSFARDHLPPQDRSEEHPSELQSLMRLSYAVLGLKQTICTMALTRQRISLDIHTHR